MQCNINITSIVTCHTDTAKSKKDLQSAPIWRNGMKLHMQWIEFRDLSFTIFLYCIKNQNKYFLI